jgi:hypothetical protein
VQSGRLAPLAEVPQDVDAWIRSSLQPISGEGPFLVGVMGLAASLTAAGVLGVQPTVGPR